MIVRNWPVKPTVIPEPTSIIAKTVIISAREKASRGLMALSRGMTSAVRARRNSTVMMGMEVLVTAAIL